VDENSSCRNPFVFGRDREFERQFRDKEVFREYTQCVQKKKSRVRPEDKKGPHCITRRDKLIGILVYNSK